MITTEYAALRYRSTPDNSLYVKRDGEIIGAVLRAHDGGWLAYPASDLLDLRNPIGQFPDRAAAIVAVDLAAPNRQAYTVVAVYADDPSQRYATTVLADSPEQAEQAAIVEALTSNGWPTDPAYRDDYLIIAGVLVGEHEVVA